MAKRFTKNMLSELTQGEIRKLAVGGMGLPISKAYTLKTADIVTWVHGHREELIGADIDKISTPSREGRTSGFRDGVAAYLKGLQLFLKKEADPPVWPGDEVEAPKEVKEVAEEPTEEKAPEEAPPEKVEAKPAKKARLPKKKLGKPKKAEPESSTGLEELGVELIATLDNRLEGLIGLPDSIEELNFRVGRLENALLFIINSAIAEEGSEFADLSELPAPDEYL
jgi:hypothetical protein